MKQGDWHEIDKQQLRSGCEEEQEESEKEICHMGQFIDKKFIVSWEGSR